MDCKTSSALIMGYVDKTIKESDWARLQEHLKICHQCREEFDTFIEMVDLIEELPLYEPSNEFEGRVMEAIDSSLYSIKEKKGLNITPLFISAGIYLTFIFTALRFSLPNEGRFNLSLIIQQFSALNNTWEKVSEIRNELLGQYLQKTMEFLIGLVTWRTINFFLAYGLSLLVLVTLLIYIKATLKGLLKRDGGDLRWVKIDTEE